MTRAPPTGRAVVVCTLVLLVVGPLAGCAQLDGFTGGSSTATPIPAGAGANATVTHVVDGDTIDVRFPDGRTDTVRLLGVDVPETRADNEPGEFEGVPDTEAGRSCLHDAGVYVSEEIVRPRLDGEEVRIVVDDVADRRGGYDRLLAYVLHDGTNLNYLLVTEGYARVYDSEFTQSERFYAAEQDAQEETRGLWGCRDDSVLDFGS